MEPMNLGEKTKNFRKQKAMSIAELGKKSNLSPSYISQMERGLVFPSVAALQKIASGLGLHVADFFDDIESAKKNGTKSDIGDSGFQIVRKNSRKGLTYAGSNVLYQMLTPDLKRNIELLLIKAPPGSDSGLENFLHEGEECGVILQGKMEYWINGSTVILEEGDSVYFKSNLPHRWKNMGENELVAIWAITPPSF